MNKLLNIVLLNAMLSITGAFASDITKEVRKVSKNEVKIMWKENGNTCFYIKRNKNAKGVVDYFIKNKVVQVNILNQSKGGIAIPIKELNGELVFFDNMKGCEEWAKVIKFMKERQ